MILDVFVILLSSILFVLLQIFELITLSIPENISGSINYFLGYFGFLKGIFPVDTAFSVVIIYINFVLLLYSFKIVMWVYAHVPFIGRSKNLPDI